MSHLHSRIECKECKKVIRSCRCMEAANNIEYVVCDVCKKTNPPQGNKGEGMREMAKEVYLKLWNCGPAINGADVDNIEQALLQVRREALEEAAKLCDYERSEYEKSMREFDERGDVRMGTNEASCASTAQLIAEAIRALATPSKEEK